MLRIGWFSTGRDAAAGELLTTVQEAIGRGRIQGRIDFVFANRAPGESADTDRFLDLAASYGLPIESLSYQRYKDSSRTDMRTQGGWPQWRLDYEREIMRRLAGREVDLCVLAGYMLVVGPEMCQRYRMLNLHPAVPGGPTGTWQEVVWKLIETEAERAGAMMHLVTPELDRGPAVTFCSFPLRGPVFDPAWGEVRGRSVAQVKAAEGVQNALFLLIRKQELAREFPLIVITLKAFGEGRVGLNNGVVVDSAGRPIAPYDLSREIDDQLRNSA